jgi:copper chaperone CopZ
MVKSMCIRVQKEFCEECALAIRRFIGGLEGVESIETAEGLISIAYDDKMVDSERLFSAVCENVEKLGYKILPKENI